MVMESLKRRYFDVQVACVTDVHIHILARFPDHNPRHWIGIAEKESSHYAKQADLAPEGGLWAVRTKSLPVNDREHQINTAKYVYDHRLEGGAVWFRENVVSPW